MVVNGCRTIRLHTIGAMTRPGTGRSSGRSGGSSSGRSGTGRSGTGRPAPGRATTAGRVVAVAALAAALLLIGASFATWLALPDGAGGTTSVSGWGQISGGSQITGQNLNDAMNGNATFRPGLVVLLFGALAIPAALAVAPAGKGAHPHRIAAVVLTLSGLIATGWAIWRLLTPDSAELLEAGEGRPGAGQWLALAGGLVLLGAAGMIFARLADPPEPLQRKGIQPT